MQDSKREGQFFCKDCNEKNKIAEYLHGLRLGYKGGMTLREWCKSHGFSSVLWSHLENGLWEITPLKIERTYTKEELASEISKAKEEVLKEVKNRFGGSVLLEASGGKIVKKTPPLDSWLQSELDKLSKKNKCSGK